MAEAYLRAKFQLDPPNRLATVHERHGHADRQGSDSIGRTVLQTVAQKPTRRIKATEAIAHQKPKSGFHGNVPCRESAISAFC